MSYTASQLEFELNESLDRHITLHHPVFDPGSHKLLIVDDDPDQLCVLSILLERAGYEVSACSSARDALERIKQENFSLIISDLKMPHMDGQNFIRALRGLNPFGRRNNLPVIILTSCDQNLELDLLKLGADMFCQKNQANRILLPQIKFLLT